MKWYEEIKQLSCLELKNHLDNVSACEDISLLEKYTKLSILFYKMEKLSLATKYFQLVYNTYLLKQEISSLEKKNCINVLKAVYYDWFLVELIPQDDGCTGTCVACCCILGAAGCTACCFGGNSQAFCDWSGNCTGGVLDCCCCCSRDSWSYKCCGCKLCPWG